MGTVKMRSQSVGMKVIALRSSEVVVWGWCVREKWKGSGWKLAVKVMQGVESEWAGGFCIGRE